MMNLVTLAALGVAAALPTPVPAEGWNHWQVATVHSIESMGCKRNGKFDLSRPQGMSISMHEDDDARRFDVVNLYAEIEKGELVTLHLLTPDCTVTGASVKSLNDMSPDASLDWLSAQLADPQDHELIQVLMAAIALHPQSRATTLLAQQAELDHERIWQPALFWLANFRAAEGEAVVMQHLQPERSVEHRRHATVVLGLTGSESGVAKVRDVALNDASAEVRGHALFALTMADEPGTVAFIDTVLRTDTADEVRQQAIFALSQIDNTAAVEVLKRLLQDPSYGEHRRSVLFWLAQMHDSEGGQIIEDLAESM